MSTDGSPLQSVIDAGTCETPPLLAQSSLITLNGSQLICGIYAFKVTLLSKSRETVNSFPPHALLPYSTKILPYTECVPECGLNMHHVTYHPVCMCASAILATLELTVVKVIVSFYIHHYYSNVLECLPGMYGFNCNQVCTCGVPCGLHC